MKAFNSYETTKVFTETEKLPVGGYIIGITGIEEIQYTWGNVLEVKFDIAQGDYKNFFTNQYKNSQLEDKKYKGTYRINIPKEDGSEKDEWTARKFKTDMMAVEDSNPGFHWDWDEKKLVGKKVGAIFFEKEWAMNGNTGFFTTLHSFKSIEKIRNNDFKIPKPKLLNKTEPSSSPQGFAAISESIDDEDLPF